MKNIMSDKQDYFIFKGQNNKLTNFFGFVSGIKVKKQNKLVESNINVLKARFSDASFFINEDKKKLIIEALWNIIYSDQNADMYEANLMRRLSGLLYLDPKVVGDIKEKIKSNQ